MMTSGGSTEVMKIINKKGGKTVDDIIKIC